MVNTPLEKDLVAILLNAIYFKGDWEYEFNKELTQSRPFYLEDGKTTNVPQMELTEELAYMENEEVQAIQLPYGSGSMTMNVYLPKDGIRLPDFKKRLTRETWEKWNTDFAQMQGTLRLPKFKMEYEMELNDALIKLGMPSAFQNKAVFTKMVRNNAPLAISEVKQKTYIDVNEKGTEAAASTSVGIVKTSLPIDQPFYMDVNRPFFMTISDSKTETILFMGLVTYP